MTKSTNVLQCDHKGDFTRDTFDPRNHFTRVLLQQGRVQLDADWNEQAAILLHHLQTLAADLTGPHSGPANNCGFQFIVDADAATGVSGSGKKYLAELLAKHDAVIGKGHYYVGGKLCEVE